MTVRLLGIGSGLFIVISIWITTLVLCLVAQRTQKNFSSVLISIATVVTLILVLIPRESKVPPQAVFKIYDDFFLWKITIAVLTSFGALVSSAVLLFMYLMKQHHAKPIKGWRL